MNHKSFILILFSIVQIPGPVGNYQDAANANLMLLPEMKDEIVPPLPLPQTSNRLLCAT